MVRVRLHAGESFLAREKSRRLLLVVGRKKATISILAGAGVRNKSKGPTSPDAAMPPSRTPAERAAAAVGCVTVEDTDALDCGVCFLPLKPPIFQCKAGHAVCSVCRDILNATGNGKCHVCGVAIGGYSRCHAMERLVESIRFSCPNAIHGCTIRFTYNDQHCHRQACRYMPCHCPSKACGFIGSTATLLDHFTRAHNWPCATKVRAATIDYGDEVVDCEFDVSLRYGFNFLVADCATSDGTTVDGSYLFLLNVARKRLGCCITVLCIHPHHDQAPPKEMQCELSYSWDVPVNSRQGGQKLINHYQESTFAVGCTDLSSGLPKPDECFQFMVLKSVLAGGDKIRVAGRIVIN